MKTKFHLIIAGISLFVTLSLTGCGGAFTDRYLTNKREMMTMEGKPQAYVDGYMDGCASGMSLAGDKRFKYFKNQVRADQDALYARGWDDGQICCRNEVLLEKQQQQQAECGYSNFDEERRRRIKERTQADEAEMRELWEQLKK